MTQDLDQILLLIGSILGGGLGLLLLMAALEPSRASAAESDPMTPVG